MATDIGDIVKQGYVRIRSRKLGLWQRRWIVLCRASSKGPCRLEKYLDEKSARSSAGHKVALLSTISNVSRMATSMKRHGFIVSFRDSTAKCMACDSDLEADTWVKLLVQESFLPQPGLATGEPDVLSPGIQKELQEQFHVYLMPTPKLDEFGECLLQVTHENIYLWDISNPRLKLVAWPLTALRRYGSDPTKFTFEAGRHCTTGEGMFVFHTLEGEKIYHKVHQATLAIAEAHHRLRKSEDRSSSAVQSQESLSNRVSIQSAPSSQDTSSYNSALELQNYFQDGGPVVVDGQPSTSGNHKQQPAEDAFRKNLQVPPPSSKCSLRSHLLQYSSKQ